MIKANHQFAKAFAEDAENWKLLLALPLNSRVTVHVEHCVNELLSPRFWCIVSNFFSFTIFFYLFKFFSQFFFVRGVTLKLLTLPPLPEGKWKIYSWDPRIRSSLLWGLSPSSDGLNQDWKTERNSSSERNLNVVLTPSSTSLWVKTAIPCLLSLNFEKQGRIAGG